MSDFITASSYCESVFDGTHDTPKPVNSGYPLVTSKHIVGRTLDISTAYYISLEDYNAIQKRSKVSQWDVLFSMIGSVGEVYLEKNEVIPYAIKNIGVFSCKNEEKARWLYYYLQSPFATTHIKRYLNGAVQKFLSLGALREFPVLKFNKQSSLITKVLSDLDAKIELNNKINRELEAMAKTLYDYWFVQFDFPTPPSSTSGIVGKPYKSSGGKMVYNEELKREIPEGWEVGTLLDIATFTNGLACQKYRPINKEFVTVIKIREMREGFTKDTEKVRPDISENLIVNNGDVLFSWSASLEVIIWTGGKGGLNQHIFKVMSKKYPRSFYYFQLIWYLQHFKMIAELRKTTMGHITQEHLKQSRIVVPPLDLIKQLDKQLNPIQEKQVLLHKQNQQLSALRDWLLPMLMNGQVASRASATEE